MAMPREPACLASDVEFVPGTLWQGQRIRGYRHVKQRPKAERYLRISLPFQQLDGTGVCFPDVGVL